MAHDDRQSFATLAIHVGSEPDRSTGAVVAPISLATTFAQAELGHPNGSQDPNSWGKGFEYSRTGNPTRGAFERAMAAVERGNYASAFCKKPFYEIYVNTINLFLLASGIAAISAVLSLFSAGDHIVCIDDVYGGSQRLFRRLLTEHVKMEFTFVDMSDMRNITSACKPNTKLIWVESPTNPTLRITDIRAVAAIAKEHKAIMVVDNTFFTPFFQNPLDLGADIVVHSVTKYIGGHSDVVMGAVILRDESLFHRLRFVQNSVGSVPSPFDCYMALRGLKTLHVRMKEAASNALAVASFLEQHAAVQKVLYPGLASHPQHALCTTQASGFGAMVTFYLKGDINTTRVFLKALKVFTLAESLGAVESLAECPAIMTHASVPPEVRAQLGISDTLIRLSVGIEGIEDLLQDLKSALELLV